MYAKVDKMRTMRDLLEKRDEIIIMPCCYDGLSARLVEMHGFPLTFMTGFGVSAVRGKKLNLEASESDDLKQTMVAPSQVTLTHSF